METWIPPRGEPELLAWWRPLLAFARRVRADQVPWPVHIDEFMLEYRVDRPGRPAIWIYRHEQSRGHVNVDDMGTPYRFIVYRRGPSAGRYQEIELSTAIWRAGLPNAVEPVWYDEPPAHVGGWDSYDSDDSDDSYGGDDWRAPRASAEPPPSRSRRRRTRHLRLVEG